MSKKLNKASIKKRMEHTSKVVSRSNEHERSELIPIDEIDLNGDNFFNKFDTEQDITELADSIRENGLIHSINVAKKQNGRYTLISGERRLKAYKKLGKSTIRATVVPGLSELEILKRTFYGNTDVRNYTLEQKLEIISMYKKKLDELSETGQYDVTEFKNDISEAFHIDSRQTNKLLAINDGLIDEFVALMCDDKLDINTGAAYSHLPEDCQRFIYGFFGDDTLSDAVRKAISEFVGKIRSVLSNEKNQKRKIQAALTYNETKIKKCEEELRTITRNSTPELEDRRKKLTESIGKNSANIGKIREDISLLEKKVREEIDDLKSSYGLIINKKINNDEETSCEKPERSEKISKEIRHIEKSVKILSDLLPADELNEILNYLNQYKSKNITG